MNLTKKDWKVLGLAAAMAVGIVWASNNVKQVEDAIG